MIVHFLDYEIQSDNYSTSEIKEIFDEKNRFKRWMKIEVALSEIESEFDIIPKESANHIKKIMENPNIDYVHVWLADEYNNACECDKCSQTSISDQYIDYINEIDSRLNEIDDDK